MKTVGRSSKDFKGCQNPLELFENVRSDDANPKKVYKNLVKFKSNLSKRRSTEFNKKCYYYLFNLRKKIFNLLGIILFRCLKLNTKLKQMLQKLPIALAQLKASNTSENLRNEIDKSYILCI